MSKYDELETTAQRVYKYLDEHILIVPKRIPYQEIANEIGRRQECSRWSPYQHGIESHLR